MATRPATGREACVTVRRMRKLALLLVFVSATLGACAKKQSTPVQSPSHISGPAPDGAASGDPVRSTPPSTPPATRSAPPAGTPSADPCMGGE